MKTNFFNLWIKFQKSVKDYLDKESKIEMPCDYHTVISFMDLIQIRADKNEQFMKKVYYWMITEGNTILLKDILCDIGYSDSDLFHFNAFATIDTCILVFWAREKNLLKKDC